MEWKQVVERALEEPSTLVPTIHDGLDLERQFTEHNFSSCETSSDHLCFRRREPVLLLSRVLGYAVLRFVVLAAYPSLRRQGTWSTRWGTPSRLALR